MPESIAAAFGNSIGRVLFSMNEMPLGIILYMEPIYHIADWDLSTIRPCIGGLEGQQPNSPGQRPGCCIPCDDSAPEGAKAFSSQQ